MEDKKYRVSYRLPKEAGQDAFNYAMNAVRREMGNKMVETLLSGRLPAVVDLTEETIDTHDPYMPVYEFRIGLEINPVQHKRITMASFDYDDIPVSVDTVMINRLETQLAYMSLGFLSLLSIIIWFIFG